MQREEKNAQGASVRVDVDVSKIVRNISIAGVLIVGIVFGCNTYRKLKRWQEED